MHTYILHTITYPHITHTRSHTCTHTHTSKYIHPHTLTNHTLTHHTHTHTYWCSSVSAADPTFLSDWKKRLPCIKDSDFQFVEPVLALRSSILHSLLRRIAVECAQEASPPIHLRRKAERVFGGLTDALLTQARLAREAGQYQVNNSAIRPPTPLTHLTLSTPPFSSCRFPAFSVSSQSGYYHGDCRL